MSCTSRVLNAEYRIIYYLVIPKALENNWMHEKEKKNSLTFHYEIDKMKISPVKASLRYWKLSR